MIGEMDEASQLNLRAVYCAGAVFAVQAIAEVAKKTASEGAGVSGVADEMLALLDDAGTAHQELFSVVQRDALAALQAQAVVQKAAGE